MKVKKEIWVEVCDFCGEPKTSTCTLCGKDICGVHSIGIEHGYTKEEKEKQNAGGYGIIIGGNVFASSFCPDHLGLELTEQYNNSLSQSIIEEKEK